MAKGQQWERLVCKRLSLWWTGDREDIFWRTANSGGRATTRSKKGQETKHQSGDISFTDSVGEPLLKALTLELKNGYSSRSIADLLDQTPKAGGKTYHDWLTKLIATHKRAGSLYWALIVKRNRREPLIFFPHALQCDLSLYTNCITLCDSIPYILLTCSSELSVVGVHLEAFLSVVKPDHIRKLVNKVR